MKHIFLSFISIFSFQFAFSQDEVFDFGKCRIRILKQSERELRLRRAADELFLTSESGRFRLHFYDSGSDALPFIDINGNSITDYIDTALVEIDEIYKQEVTDLGMSFPNLETVDIYFYSIGDLYGETTLSSNCDYPYTGKSEIHVNSLINADFLSTNGMDMIRVTLAHEFHHVLQFQKGAWMGRDCSSDSFSSYDFLFYYEMAAVFYEEAVYDRINDYYSYIKYGNGNGRTVFAEPNSPSLYSNAGNYIYGSGIFFIFIRDQYGLQKAKEVEKRILELLPDYPPTVSMAKACTDVLNVPVTEVFHNYSTAVSLTQNWKMDGRSFSEADSYPLLAKKANSISVSDVGTVSMFIPISPTGFSIYWLSYNGREYPLVFSNGNFEQFNDEGYSTAPDNMNVFVDLKRLSVEFSVQNLRNFKTIKASLIDTVSNSVYDFSAKSVYKFDGSELTSFPNPVNLSKSEVLNIPVKGSSDSPKIILQIFDITGKVLLSKTGVAFSSDLIIFEINLLKDLKPQVSSGVYFYFASSGDKVLNSGKFAVIK